MKKLEIFLMIILVSACTEKTVYVDRETLSNHNIVYIDGKKSRNRHVTLVDITINGETHQYISVFQGNSFSHWEGCTYCKHHIEEKTENER